MTTGRRTSGSRVVRVVALWHQPKPNSEGDLIEQEVAARYVCFHPVLAAAGAIELVLFGAILGAWMDRGAWRSYVGAETVSGQGMDRPLAAPTARREPAAPRPTQ